MRLASPQKKRFVNDDGTDQALLFGSGTPLVFGTAILASAFVLGGAYLMYRKRPSYDRGLLMGCLTGVNLGTFAYPFLEAVWGAEGLRLAALYDIPNGIIVFGLASGIFAAAGSHPLTLVPFTSCSLDVMNGGRFVYRYTT